MRRRLRQESVYLVLLLIPYQVLYEHDTVFVSLSLFRWEMEKHGKLLNSFLVFQILRALHHRMLTAESVCKQ